MLRARLMIRGLEFEIGSLRERVMMMALQMEDATDLAQTKAVISGSGEDPKFRAEAFRGYRDILFPDMAEETEKKAERVKEMLNKETSKTLQVTPLDAQDEAPVFNNLRRRRV